MGTEVLRPHDCLVNRFPLDPYAYQRRRSYFENRNGGGFINSKPAKINRPERLEKKNKWKKEFQQPLLTIQKRSFSENELLLQNVHRNIGTNNNNYEHPYPPSVETGRVKILRRGQSFDSFDNTKIRNEINGSDSNMYAGSAFSMSPPPNSLPLPSFFNNNKKFEYEDSASKDLRRLLGLK